MDLAEHVEALVAHTQPDLVDLVIANDRFNGEDAAVAGRCRASRAGRPPSTRSRSSSTEAVASPDDPHHHDPERLAAAILRAIEREGTALRRERVARIA